MKILKVSDGRCGEREGIRREIMGMNLIKT